MYALCLSPTHYLFYLSSPLALEGHGVSCWTIGQLYPDQPKSYMPPGVGLSQLVAVNHSDISWTARSIRGWMEGRAGEKVGQTKTDAKRAVREDWDRWRQDGGINWWREERECKRVNGDWLDWKMKGTQVSRNQMGFWMCWFLFWSLDLCITVNQDIAPHEEIIIKYWKWLY